MWKKIEMKKYVSITINYLIFLNHPQASRSHFAVSFNNESVITNKNSSKNTTYEAAKIYIEVDFLMQM